MENQSNKSIGKDLLNLMSQLSNDKILTEEIKNNLLGVNHHNINIVKPIISNNLVNLMSIPTMILECKNYKELEDVIHSIMSVKYDESMLYIWHYFIENVFSSLNIIYKNLQINKFLYINLILLFQELCIGIPVSIRSIIYFHMSISLINLDQPLAHEFAVRADECGCPYSKDLIFITSVILYDSIPEIKPSISLALNSNLKQVFLDYLKNKNLIDKMTWYIFEFDKITNIKPIIDTNYYIIEDNNLYRESTGNEKEKIRKDSKSKHKKNKYYSKFNISE